MKELIPMNDFGLMSGRDLVARVDSRVIAKVFGKQHYNVLRDIENYIALKSEGNKEFVDLNFQRSTYIDSIGRKQRCYLLTKDGFTLLVMGYSGEKAIQFKIAYINRFNEMAHQISTIKNLRDVNPKLTEAINDAHEDPKPYHYSNEADMLNRIVLGMSAKKYRETYGIPKSVPIRPHFSPDEAELMDHLQRLDIGFICAFPDYQERKQALEKQAVKWREKRCLPVTVPEEIQ